MLPLGRDQAHRLAVGEEGVVGDRRECAAPLPLGDRVGSQLAIVRRPAAASSRSSDQLAAGRGAPCCPGPAGRCTSEPNARATASALSARPPGRRSAGAVEHRQRERDPRHVRLVPACSTPTTGRSLTSSCPGRGTARRRGRPARGRAASGRGAAGLAERVAQLALVVVGAAVRAHLALDPVHLGGEPSRAGRAAPPWPSRSSSSRPRGRRSARRPTTASRAPVRRQRRRALVGAFGVEPPVRHDVAGRARGLDEQLRARRRGVSLTRARPSASRQHRARRGERGPVGRVAQQRLADALAEDAGLAARGAEHHPRRLLAARGLRLAVSPPGPRKSESFMPEAVSISRRPGPGPASSRPTSSRSAHLPSSRAGRCDTRPPSSSSSGAGSQPSREASQPHEQAGRDDRVGVVAHGDRRDLAQRRAPAAAGRRSRRPLAPRRRCAATRGRRRRRARAATRALDAPRAGRAT